MNNYKNWLIMLLIASIYAGCNTFNPDNSSYPDAGIADDGLEISFREFNPTTSEEQNQNGAEPELFLVMRTKKILGCVNYHIDYEVNEQVGEPLVHEILLKGINLPGGMCLTAIGPATAQVSFRDMPDEVELLIRDGQLRDRFKIEVSTMSVKIIPLATSFTETEYLRYHRKPENSFYFNCGTLNSMRNLCQDFHDLMKSELSITEFTFPDVGYIPYPDSSGGNQFNHPSRFYTYPAEAEFHKAGDLLEQFTREKIGDTQGNSLSIINWKEEGYRSWIFQN